MGELVALDSQGKPSFKILQNNLSQSLPIYFYAFDLLNRDGGLLMNLPFSRRRELLERIFTAPKDPLRLSPLLHAPSGQVLEAVPKLGLGRCRGQTDRFRLRTRRAIRRVDQAPHQPRAGVRRRRLHSWDARVRGVARGRLREQRARLRCEGEEWLCAAIRDEIFPALKTLRVAHCPFTNLPEKRASRWGESLTAEKMDQCRWVKPKLVCQVAFLELTDAGHLRHCTFVAMRDDKKPTRVVRET